MVLRVILLLASLAPTPTPTPEPTPEPTVVVVTPMIQGTVTKWLEQSNWPPEYWKLVTQIVRCESSNRPGAVGPLGHRGLMQVDPNLWGPVPTDPVEQLNQGYHVFLTQGWSAWDCYFIVIS